MKNTFSRLAFLVIVLFLIACSSPKQKNIVVYGSSQCHHCVDFLQQLDSAKMTYEFKDFMLAEKGYDAEMLHKLDSVNFREYINLPVVFVETEWFVDAKFKDVKVAAFK